jgi:predicted NBD/HSP70 family sugar kinase
MHPSVVRQIHASRIFHAVRLYPFMSQREIAERSGADKSTVSAIVREFEATGLVERTRGPGSGPGRPGERISLSPRGGLLIGVHPRPSEIRFVAAGLDGNPLGTLSRPMPPAAADLPEAAACGIHELTNDIGRRPADIRAIGVSISGLVDTDGHLAQSPNLGWRDVPLRRILRQAIKHPLYIGNNSNSAAIAEQMFGHGTETDNFLYVESGSGVGGGLILDGSLYRGAVGYSGEIGHTKVVPGGRPCRCGSSGCLSAYVADHAILRHLQEEGVDVHTPSEILARAEAGNGVALAALEDAGTHLGVALANLVNLLNPPLIVVGGGLARFAPHMMPSMRRSLHAMSMPAPLSACSIEVSAVSLEPIPRGGVALALEGCTSLAASEDTPW